MIDADGGWIRPVFCAYTQLGLIEGALEASTNDAGADDSDFSVALDVADSFNPAGTFPQHANGRCYTGRVYQLHRL